MRKIKLTRKAKRQLTAIIVIAILGALMLGLGAVTVAAGVVIVLGEGWTSAMAMMVSALTFAALVGLGGMIGRLVNVHFR